MYPSLHPTLTKQRHLKAQKNRDAHQKRLNEMLEETLRQIKKCRAHMQQLGLNMGSEIMAHIGTPYHHGTIFPVS